MAEKQAHYQVNKPRDWGRILVVTRLEKMVDAQFVAEWSHLISIGMRDGRAEIVEALREIKDVAVIDDPRVDRSAIIESIVDKALSHNQTDGFIVVKDRVAHQAFNDAVRVFLQTDFDTLFTIDSDWSGGPGYLEELRNLEDGYEFDIFQGFYTRRGWPPEAIWFVETELGDTQQAMVWKDNHTEPTAMVGFHNALIRREVFETMLEQNPEIDVKDFNWAYYPRHGWQSEDGTFCDYARRLGFKIGSTTKVKCGHISRVVVGWETYQEYLQNSGAVDHWRNYYDLVELVSDFTGESYDTVIAKANRGYQYPMDRWNELDPQTADEIRAFYGDPNNGYVYDLLAWNTTPGYKKLTDPLKRVENKSVLIVGAGLGGEIEVLKDKNSVTAFELYGVLSQFLLDRYKNDLDFDLVFGDRLEVDIFEKSGYTDGRRQSFDLIVALDVIEHIPPDEFDETLDVMIELLKPDGIIYAHNNFGAQDLAPQHFDHAERFSMWLERNEIEQISDLEYKRKGIK